MSPAPAQLPPPGIVGIDRVWSRLVTAPDHRGIDCTWHLLDNAVEAPRLTLLCVHGNPSWSFLWRDVIRRAPDDVRVLAVDQLEMGFSERTGQTRRLADRVSDLVALTDQLGLDGPICTVAHDWGGPISLGWAQHILRRRIGTLAGVVLTNTAVHQPEGSPAPALIRAARSRGISRTVTVNTAAFVRGSHELSRPRLEPDVRAAFLAPYKSRERRQGIADFVADIPLDSRHPSNATLDDIAAGLDELADVPALLLWGPSDPVFSDLYLHDLEARLPHAQVHRFVGAGHFVSEQADVVGAILAWIDRTPSRFAVRTVEQADARAPLWAELDRLGDSAQTAVTELTSNGARSISFSRLRDRVMAFGAGLLEDGVQPGDRIALMIPPGIDLTVALYGCWRIGATAVMVDAGLGRHNMSRALAAANPKYFVGVRRALIAARALGWPGRRFVVGDLGRHLRAALRVRASMADLEIRGRTHSEPVPPDDDVDAVIAFTSGSTGPSKGVVYRHHQLQAQRDQLRDLYQIGPTDRLVAAFAPFALYGPALGIQSAVPAMDIARPGSLHAAALGDAVGAVEATLVFASPAALDSVVATASELARHHKADLGGVRLVLSAGAPVNPGILRRTLALFPSAEAHTPYGMTEVLPVCDISLGVLEAVEEGHRGVCVGSPCQGVDIAVSALDNLGNATGVPTRSPGVLGEVLVRAPHSKDRYERLWYTEHRSNHPEGWHRSGDIGQLDDDGRLWIGGRLEHVLLTADGPLAPVPIEQAAESVTAVLRAAAVGVGPPGAQVIAVVAETDGTRRGHLASTSLASSVRATVAQATGTSIAAVLQVGALPVDRRHNSKIDRSRVAQWAGRILAGRRRTRL